MAFITINDLQDYRKRTTTWSSRCGQNADRIRHVRRHGFRNTLNGEHHVALVKGDIGDGENVLVRVHSDALRAMCSARCAATAGEQLAASMRQIEQEDVALFSTCARKAAALAF